MQPTTFDTLFLEAPRNARGGPDRLASRFWSRVARNGDIDCWQWTGAINDRGYGRFWTPWKPTACAHRVAVTLDGRDIPDGMVVDHVCRNRLCVNPAHLRVVTVRENALENTGSIAAANARKTHCNRGHPLSGSNLIAQRNGRACRTCKRASDLNYYHRTGSAKRRGA